MGLHPGDDISPERGRLFNPAVGPPRSAARPTGVPNPGRNPCFLQVAIDRELAYNAIVLCV